MLSTSLVTLYHLFFCAALGCTPVDSGHYYHGYNACVAHKTQATDLCVRETNTWERD